jgi:hypothetical protein
MKTLISITSLISAILTVACTIGAVVGVFLKSLTVVAVFAWLTILWLTLTAITSAVNENLK